MRNSSVKMHKSVITKNTKSSDEKNSFLSVFHQHNIENINKIIPIVKILSSEPKPGCTWLTYSHPSNTSLSDDAVKIYIAKEHFGKDGANKKIYIKNEAINYIFLTSLNGTLQKYNTITTLKLQNCNLLATEIEILHNMLKEFKNITDLNLDENPNKHQNYYALLQDTKIKYLSLKGCKINNFGIEMLCRELTFEKNSDLVTLNLSSNYIDDTALSFLVQILRENRKIIVLILADNWITDTGCQLLMSVFQTFTLTDNEIRNRRKINLHYYVQKAKLLEQYKQDPSKIAGSATTTAHTRRKTSTFTGIEKSSSTLSRESSLLSQTHTHESHIEKHLAKRSHPFVTECSTQNGEIFCPGNLTVAHLNLAYNKLSASGYKHVINTLQHQLTGRSGKIGLLNIVLDGNYEEKCHEFLEIKHFLLEQRKKLTSRENNKMKNSSRRSVSKYSSMSFK